MSEQPKPRLEIKGDGTFSPTDETAIQRDAKFRYTCQYDDCQELADVIEEAEKRQAEQN